MNSVDGRRSVKDLFVDDVGVERGFSVDTDPSLPCGSTVGGRFQVGGYFVLGWVAVDVCQGVNENKTILRTLRWYSVLGTSD